MLTDSVNVLNALKVAHDELNVGTVLMTGQTPIKTDYVQQTIQVPSKSTERIQEGHLVIGHILCELAEKVLLEL